MQERQGLHAYEHGLKNQALLRPLGGVVYFMPPYIITSDQIDILAEVTLQGIEPATKD